MRALVCGGRDFADKKLLFRTLDELNARSRIVTVIEGDASGADRLAGAWAREHQVEGIKFPADWAGQGRAAGPIRNKRMLDKRKPDLVVAFPGGKGTANMVKQAKARSIKVLEVPSF